MYEQFNTKQLLAMSKQFSDTAFKAHGLAIAGFEKAIDLQLKTLENNVNATVGFWTEASEIRDLDGVRTLFPKSVALAKDSAEKMYAVSQELVGLSVKTTEAIGDLVKGQFEVANDAFGAKPAAAKKK
jgi:phasin family protein